MPIVISPSLVLSDLVEGNPDAPLLGWHNLVTVDGIAADEQDASYPATNLANPSTALRWQAQTTGDQYITFTVSAGAPIDYLGIARHNLGSGQVTVSVEIPHEVNEGEWREVVAEFIPANDQPLVLPFEAVTTSVIRLRLQPDLAIPRMAVVYVGALLRLPRGLQPGLVPPTWAANDEVVAAQSEAGDYLGAITLQRSLSFSVSVQYLNYDWWRANMPSFIEHARSRKPFFFAWLPATYPDEVGYAWTQSDIRPDAQILRQGVVVGFDMDMRAVAL